MDDNYSDFTEGLMELGALICTPQNPKCHECPLKHKCLSNKNNTQEHYPIKTTPKKNPILKYKTLIIIKDNKILLSTNDQDGLMKGFYRCPQYEEINTNGYEFIKQVKHIYSHKTWIMDVYQYIDGEIPNDEYVVWKNIDELNEIPMIGAHLKILK